jgi:hypothetical protein
MKGGGSLLPYSTVPRPSLHQYTNAVRALGFVLLYLFSGAPCHAFTRYVILVDLSKSAKPVVDDYKNRIHNTLMVLQEGDSALVLAITEDSFGNRQVLLDEGVMSSQARPKRLALENCEPYGNLPIRLSACKSGNSQKQKEWNQMVVNDRNRIAAKWNSVALQSISQSTDILGALKYVESLVGSGSNRGVEVVIYSDMRHNTRGVDLSSPPQVDQKILSTVKRKHLLPNLKDVSVRVFGAHTLGKDPAYFESLENFWKLLFRESGADLREFRPDVPRQ